jgi:hypothetical protein
MWWYTTGLFTVIIPGAKQISVTQGTCALRAVCCLPTPQVARYMSQMRRNRLQKLQNRQDDEVVGIAGLYLAITLLVLFMAALANLPI